LQKQHSYEAQRPHRRKNCAQERRRRKKKKKKKKERIADESFVFLWMAIVKKVRGVLTVRA
jgi:hypothetical protein